MIIRFWSVNGIAYCFGHIFPIEYKNMYRDLSGFPCVTLGVVHPVISTKGEGSTTKTRNLGLSSLPLPSLFLELSLCSHASMSISKLLIIVVA